MAQSANPFAGFKQLLDATRPPKKGGYQLSVANALWGQKGYGFLPAFLKLVRSNYGAPLNEVDFVGATEAARKTINDWVEKETRDKIKDLIKPGVLDSLTTLVLTNAIYFKGDWASQFNEDVTKDAPFTLSAAEKVDVPMMNQKGDFGYMETEGFQALELPYAGDDLSMVVFLPRKVDGLKGFEKMLTMENLRRWISNLRKQKVIVFLPRFKMTSAFRLGQALKSLGMIDAFTLVAADFSGMNGSRDEARRLYIQAVIHKAFVDVNEEGTEAAAATAVVAAESVRPAPPVFRADHPFFFLIRDNRTGSLLFLGRVMNPQ